MTSTDLVRLSDVANTLAEAGYQIGDRSFAGFSVVVAETQYALVACFYAETWDDLDEHVFDVQGALTHLAEESPSARAWDLYVVVLAPAMTNEARHRALSEVIEGDTRYARKLVRAGVTHDTLDRALRPLLPLREPSGLEMVDPIGELLAELESLDISEELARRAITSFERTDAVEVM